jgi:uncharacterized RDD family membrane protein YckC
MSEGPPRFPGNAPPPPQGSPGGEGPPAFPSQAAPPGGGPAGTPGRDAGLATWGIRVGGYVIDAVIFLVVTVVLVVLLRHTHALELHLMARRGARRRNISALPFLLSGALWVVYGTFLIGSARGQTVGMMAVGVRAVRAEGGQALGYGRALGRAVVEGVFRLLELLFILLGVIWLLDMLFPLWDARRQTLHDKIAGSVVLRVGRSAAGALH